MAVVDFSNAVITWVGSNNLGDMAIAGLWANTSDNTFTAAANDNTSIVANETASRNNVSTSHITIVRTGTMTASGNKMILHNKNISGDLAFAFYEISNISFNTGDTFSFIIDINFTT